MEQKTKKIDRDILLDLVASCAYVAYFNVLSGCQSPAQKAYFDRCRKPIIGDLVLESTTMCRAKPIDRIGRLVSVAREPYPEHEDCKPAITREIWTIETLDGRLFGWENCNFVVIPEHPFNHQMRIDRG